MTTTQLSLNYLRKNGLVEAVTETWLTFPGKDRKTGIPTGKTVRIKRDLFFFADIFAFDPVSDETVLVQTTTTVHQAERVSKIRGLVRSDESLKCAAVARQWLTSKHRKIVVHGWLKSAKSKRWEVTVTEIERDSCVDQPAAANDDSF